MEIAFQLLVNVAIAGSINALLGVGMQLVYTTTRVLHLAHGVTVLIAGYATYELQRIGIPFPTALLGACAAAGAVGIAMERCVYHPLRRRGATGFALLLASLALLAVGTNALLLRYTAGTVRLPSPFPTSALRIAGALMTPLQLVIIGTTAIFFLMLAAILTRTRFGVALRAVADHSGVAAIVGIPVPRVQSHTMLLASGLGGVAGALLASELSLHPELATLYAVKGFAAAVIGGVGSIPGAILGGFVLAGFQQVGAYLLSGGWQDALAFGLVFCFLVLRPQGLLGRRA